MKNNVLKGSLFIALGASSYGMLAAFVKMAYQEGFSTAEVTLSQYIMGFTGLLILSLFSRKKLGTKPKTFQFKSTLKLILAGTSLGLTSTFYYLSVQYIPVSAAIVLLMQTVWMGVIVEMIIYKTMPGIQKIVSVIIILTGTVLATNLLHQSAPINWIGFFWGFMAALSYTATMYSSNNIELDSPPLRRSLFMILGGFIIIALIFHSSINVNFSLGIFMRWESFFLCLELSFRLCFLQEECL